MDLVKQYIVQCVQAAANNLRLSSEKIEVVALLREHLVGSEKLEEEIKELKKITEFSKFAIKLDSIYQHIAKDKVDFLKISDQFKANCGMLVNEMNFLLDVISPQIFKEKIKQVSVKVDQTDQIKNKETSVIFKNAEVEEDERPIRDELKEKFILEDLKQKDNFDFNNYESEILKPIKQLDAILNDLESEGKLNGNYSQVLETVKINTELCNKMGFSVLSNMHKIFHSGFEMMLNKDITPSNQVIEALRACLIVIVALVRGKEVDISVYLTRAENFGKLLNIN